jgi:hypothetical protein
MRRAGVVQTVADLISFARIVASSIGASNSTEVQVEAHEDDAGEQSCELWSHAPLQYKPIEDTEALYVELGDERVVFATKDRTHQIEIADGEVVVRALGSATAARILLKPNGDVEIGASATQFVALASLVEAQLTALKTAISGAATVANDGGAAFKTNLLTALASWPATTAATKTKAL